MSHTFECTIIYSFVIITVCFVTVWPRNWRFWIIRNESLDRSLRDVLFFLEQLFRDWFSITCVHRRASVYIFLIFINTLKNQVIYVQPELIYRFRKPGIDACDLKLAWPQYRLGLHKNRIPRSHNLIIEIEKYKGNILGFINEIRCLLGKWTCCQN